MNGRVVVGIVAGVLAGLVATELGLRLHFPEHEANRDYWGRGTFVAAPPYPYRHAPDTTAWVGREGLFGHPITTNAWGYRDARIATDAADGPRVMLVGASFAFGIGVEDDDRLFHIELERALRARSDWPDDSIVFNVSQTGYNAAWITRLMLDERARFQPDVVVQLVPHGFGSQRSEVSDVVDGYRLDPARMARGSFVDAVRTRVFLWMRARSPFDGGVRFHRGRSGAPSVSPDTEAEDPAVLRERFAEFVDALAQVRRDGIAHYLVPIGGARALRPGFASAGARIIDLPSPPAWTPYLPDPHWNEQGHREAAEIVAGRLPPFDRIETRRTRIREQTSRPE